MRWFLVCDLMVLCFRLFQYKYQLNILRVVEKALGKLFGAAIPHNLKELQAAMGKLNFVVNLVSSYSRISSPLEELMRHIRGQ